MSRIFLILALFAITLLGTNLLIGLSIGDYNASVTAWREQAAQVRSLERRRPPAPDDELQAARDALKKRVDEKQPMTTRVRMHWMVGVTAALITILVNSITVTYFVGTSRWCKEVCDAYSLDQALSNRCTILKRKTFPWAVTGMLTIVGLVALGAASEPANSMVADPSAWVLWHFIGALVAFGIIGYSFWIQATNIQTNYALVQGVMEQVRQIRSERGLTD